MQTTVLEGLVAEGITEYAQNQGMKLIILSSHGRHGLTQWGISSITQKIILSAQTSLLIVRAHQYGTHSGELSETPVYQRILVPLDGSQRAENVLPIITQLAHFHKSQIHLVQVVQTPEMARQMPPAREDIDLSNRVVARNREEAERYLEQVKSRSYLEGIAVQTHLITSDNAAVALHQLEEQEHIDMVALSAHGYSGNHQWPYGSMVNNFILYGKVPLLIVQDLPAKQEPTSPELLIKRTRRALTYANCSRRSFYLNQPIQTQIVRLREFAHHLAKTHDTVEISRPKKTTLLEYLKSWELALRNANAIFKAVPVKGFTGFAAQANGCWIIFTLSNRPSAKLKRICQPVFSTSYQN